MKLIKGEAVGKQAGKGKQGETNQTLTPPVLSGARKL